MKVNVIAYWDVHGPLFKPEDVRRHLYRLLWDEKAILFRASSSISRSWFDNTQIGHLLSRVLMLRSTRPETYPITILDMHHLMVKVFSFLWSIQNGSKPSISWANTIHDAHSDFAGSIMFMPDILSIYAFHICATMAQLGKEQNWRVSRRARSSQYSAWPWHFGTNVGPTHLGTRQVCTEFLDHFLLLFGFLDIFSWVRSLFVVFKGFNSLMPAHLDISEHFIFVLNQCKCVWTRLDLLFLHLISCYNCGNLSDNNYFWCLSSKSEWNTYL